MTLPIKQTSKPSLLSPFFNKIFQLKTEELHTEPNPQPYEVSLKALTQKYDSQNTQKHRFSQKIKSIQTRYYDSSLIYMENEIDFHDSKEYLKRFYFIEQFEGKINMLGEYYKYHNDHPRIFLSEVQKIMTNFQEEQRELEYNKVREKIEEERLANQQKQNLLEGQNPNLKHVDSKTNIHQNNQKKSKKNEFILQNILQQYAADFEKDSEQKNTALKESHEKAYKRKTSANPTISSKEKTLHKNSQATLKRLYSSTQDHQKSRQTSKYNLKKSFALKNAQIKEIKNLQSKYTQILSELFKKKRSSSKASIFDHKVESQKNRTQEKVFKQDEVAKQSEKKNLENLSAVAQVQGNQQNNESRKTSRPKSQATMNPSKSNKMLKTFKAKISSNEIYLNLKPLNHQSEKQTQRQKNEDHAKELSLKRDKLSSSKSLKQSINQKVMKSVKVFEISKKDLVVQQSSKNSSVQKDLKCNQNERKKSISRNYKNEDKENQINEIPVSKEKKRVSSFKTGLETKDTQKRKESIKKPEKESRPLGMFGRVIKTKIRG